MLRPTGNDKKIEPKIRLEHTIKEQRGGMKYLYSFLHLGTRWRLVVNTTPRSLCPREGDPAQIVQEAGWTRVPVWRGAGNLALTAIRSPDSTTGDPIKL